MKKRRRRRGRPRTGHDPVVGVRLPAACIGRIDKMAMEIGADRSMIIRLMVEHVLKEGSFEVHVSRSLLLDGLLGWKGHRGRIADQIAFATIEEIKARAAAYLAARKGTKTKARRTDIIGETHVRPQLPRT